MPNRILVSTEDGMEEPAWLPDAEQFAQKAMEAAGYDGEEVSRLFCTDAFIKDLNREYRNIDAATDVLSFEDGSSYTDEAGNEWFCAGDIAISLETLPVNAEYFKTDQNDELKRLIVHGILHLNGLDHGEEHVQEGVEPVCEMLKIQKKILLQLKEEKIIN